MKLSAGGKSILEAEVTHIDMQGIWVLTGNKESFLSFATYPSFRSATVGQIHNVERLNNDHLYWPDLDIDLPLELIEHPDQTPLVGK